MIILLRPRFFILVVVMMLALFYASLLKAESTLSGQELHLGVLSIAPPSRIYKKWQPFVGYVSEKMQQPVSIVVPRGFGSMKKAVTNGEIDFFYVNSYVFYRLKQEGKAVGVLQMKNISGQTSSQSEIFVRKDSSVREIEDLKGKDIAYVSPMGAGGYLAPRALLKSHGVNSGVEVKEYFTKNLSSSIHNVLLKDNMSGTMCGVNFDLMSKKIDMGELRILAVSEPYPENVIAARSSLEGDIIERFKQVVSNMQQDPEGKKIMTEMNSMKIQAFIPYDPSIEKITEKLIRQAELTH